MPGRHSVARVAAALAAMCALAGCGDEHQDATGELSIGLTEFHPALLSPADVAGRPPNAALLRERLLALRPRWYRLQVDWSAAQPSPGRPPDWEEPGTGGYSPAAQLRAAAAARREVGGFEPVVTFLGMPAWAGRPPGGCLAGAPPTARAISPTALPAYRAMVESLLALSEREGIPIRFWSAWNEPNVNFYLAPQRARCSSASPSLAAASYAPLVRTLRAALDAAPGEQRVLVGETSSPQDDRPGVTSLGDFVRDLPPDVLCAGEVYALHQYAGDADRLDELKGLLRDRPCPDGPLPIWITETGAGRDGPENTRSTDPDTQRASCRAMDSLLRRWYRDPQVEAAFQFTFHENPDFAVGLVTPAYDRFYPVYALWRAWGARASAADSPPALPSECG